MSLDVSMYTREDGQRSAFAYLARRPFAAELIAVMEGRPR